MTERSKIFFDRVKGENAAEWIPANILKFFQYQKERYERKEIAAGTVKLLSSCKTVL